MTISSISSVASTLLGSDTSSVSSTSSDASLEKQKQTIEADISKENQSKDSATAKAQKLQDYNRELQKVDLELQQLYKSSATAPATKPKGSTSGLVDESA